MINDDEILTSDKFADDRSGESELEAAFAEIDKLQNSSNSSQEIQELEPVEEEEKDSEDEDEENDEIDNSEDPLEEELPPKVLIQKEGKKLDKLWKVKRSFFKAKAEKRILEEKVAQLEGMLNQAEVAGTYQYGRNVYAELERAKEIAQKAIEEHDSKAFIEASTNLVNAQYKVNELEKLAAQNPNYQDNQQHYAPQVPYEDETEITEEWLSSHKELQPKSKYYNRALAESTYKIIHNLDYELDRAGRRDMYLTPEYFDYIERHIDDWKTKAAKKRKSLEGVSHVGGVRSSSINSQNNKSSGRSNDELTEDEIEMARLGGFTEQEWKESKLELQRKGKL